MGFHNVNGKLTTDGSPEDEIMYLCRSYPNMRVYVGHPRRAATAIVYFLAALGDSNKKEFNYYFDPNLLLTKFDNGSTIRFIGFNVAAQVAYPEPPVHIFTLYSTKNNSIIRNMGVSMRKYEDKLNHWHKDLFPMLYDKPNKARNGYLFTGEDFYEEYERVVQEVEYQRDVLGKETFYRVDAGFEPDISPYESAVDVEKNNADRVSDLEREIEALKKLIK